VRTVGTRRFVPIEEPVIQVPEIQLAPPPEPVIQPVFIMAAAIPQMKIKNPILKLEGKNADGRQKELSSWLTRMDSYLGFHGCVDVTKRNMASVPLIRYQNEAGFAAAHPQGFVPPHPIGTPVGTPPLAAVDWAGYQVLCVNQDAINLRMGYAVYAITSGLDGMSLNTYITTQPLIAGNPYLIMEKIRGDLYQDAPAVILMKRQEFGNLKIADNELAEDFALRVRSLAFEISIIDGTRAVTDADMVQQFNSGISSNPVYQQVFIGSTSTFSNQPNVEEAAKQYTNYCRMTGAKPISGNSKKLLRIGSSDGNNRKGKLVCWHCGESGHSASVHGKGVDLPYKPADWKPRREMRAGDMRKRSSKSAKKDDGKVKKSSKKSFKIQTIRLAKGSGSKMILQMSSNDDQVLFDSGAEVTAFRSEPDGLEITHEDPHRTLIFGNNQTSKVLRVGALGGLKDIHISDDLSENVISVARLCRQGYKVVFAKDDMYLC
jgi:hypothetical protein